MADEDEKSYLCVIKSENDRVPQGIRFGTDLDELKAWSRLPKEERGSKPEPEDSAEKASEKESFLEIMQRVVRLSFQQKEMLSILSMLQSMFPMITFQKEGIDGILSSNKVEYEEGATKILLVTNKDMEGLASVMEKAFHYSAGFDHVPNALLLSIVATFDGIMSEAIRTSLRVKSDRLRSSGKKISLSEILESSSIEEVVESFITDEVYAFSRNSHDDQVKYIEDVFSVSIRSHWKRWPDFIEIFERRNLVAHGESLFTKRYISICSKHNHKGIDSIAGKPITVTFSYLRQSHEVLVEFALLTLFSLWKKHVKDGEQDAFSALIGVTYDLTLKGQWRIAVNVADYALTLKSEKFKEADRLRLVVNLASAQRHGKLKEAAMKTLDKEDWSAVSDDYKVCVAALREDVDAVIGVLPVVKATNSVTLSDFREWPVFDYVRGDAKLNEAFIETFGEPLKKGTTIPHATINDSASTSNATGEDVAPVDIETGTMH